MGAMLSPEPGRGLAMDPDTQGKKNTKGVEK